MNVGGIEVGGSAPCRFVAEISNNHNGDMRRAKRLIAAAAGAGADFVKFQAYTPDELVALRGDGPAPEPWGSQGWTMRTLYEKAQTPLEWFPDLFAYARQVGIVAFSSVFGPESLALLESLNCPAYKIASLDRNNHLLIGAVYAAQKPVIISAPLRNLIPGELQRDVGDSAPGWSDCQEATLYCPPGYPQELEAFELARAFGDVGHYHGLSSHCLDTRLPIAAVARGCKMIEMHMQLSAEPSVLEANVSLTQHEFACMVADVRATEVMCGI